MILTVEQVVDAARNDVAFKVQKGSDVNVHSIDSVYSQWANDMNAASLAITKLFEEEFPKYLK